jgi:hypothetical protein
MAENLKLVFTYVIALIIIVGGGIMLYNIRLDPPESGSATLSLAIAGFIGGAITYVFNREAATQATRAAQASSDQGATQAQASSAQGADQGSTVPH